jgi:hypothetical protein
MSEREAFGSNLRRQRVQRGVSLECLAASTKVSAEIWADLERSDLSRWPTGIYARAYMRAYASAIGADPDTTVDEFCRLFPNGDRRAERVVRGHAALIGHNLRWRDDLVGSTVEERRATARRSLVDAPRLAFTRTGRVVAAVVDLGAVVAATALFMSVVPLRMVPSLALSALAYHAVAMVALGCTPAVWAIDTYLSNRHPNAVPARGGPRFLRLIRGSDRLKA